MGGCATPCSRVARLAGVAAAGAAARNEPDVTGRTRVAKAREMTARPIAGVLARTTGRLPDMTGPTRLTTRPPPHGGVGGIARKGTTLEPPPEICDVYEGESTSSRAVRSLAAFPTRADGHKRRDRNLSSAGEFIKAGRRAPSSDHRPDWRRVARPIYWGAAHTATTSWALRSALAGSREVQAAAVLLPARVGPPGERPIVVEIPGEEDVVVAKCRFEGAERFFLVAERRLDSG
jgi:hypothetical protein